MKNEGPALFGRDWLMKIPLRWEEIKVKQVAASERLTDRLEKLIADSEVFETSVGKVKGVQAQLKA